MHGAAIRDEEDLNKTKDMKGSNTETQQKREEELKQKLNSELVNSGATQAKVSGTSIPLSNVFEALKVLDNSSEAATLHAQTVADHLGDDAIQSKTDSGTMKQVKDQINVEKRNKTHDGQSTCGRDDSKGKASGATKTSSAKIKKPKKKDSKGAHKFPTKASEERYMALQKLGPRGIYDSTTGLLFESTMIENDESRRSPSISGKWGDVTDSEDQPTDEEASMEEDDSYTSMNYQKPLTRLQAEMFRREAEGL